MTASEINLQLENAKYQLQTAHEQINKLLWQLVEANITIALLTETQADILGGAI